MPYFHAHDQFDLYTLQQCIGSGATAEVWKVGDPLGRTYALKILAPGVSLDEYGKQLFRDEFERAFGLQHPHILPVHQFGEFEGRPFILMPFMDKGSLTSRLRERLMERGRKHAGTLFSERELAQVVAQVSDALHFLGSRNILHLDIKPDNILIEAGDDGDNYLISDFGISTQLRNTIMRQTRGNVHSEAGMTPAYAAPERFLGEVNPKSDIFSLGILLYELATGRIPMEEAGTNLGSALNHGASVPELPGDYSRRFKALVARCLAKHPTERCSPSDLKTWSETYLRNGFWPTQENQVPPQSAVPTEEDVEIQKARNDFRNRYNFPNEQEIAIEPSGKTEETATPASHPIPRRKPRRLIMAVLASLVLLSAGGFATLRHLERKAEEHATQLWKTGSLAQAAEAYTKLCDGGMQSHCTMARRTSSLQARYREMTPFESGMARVQDRKTLLYGYVDTSARESIPPLYDDGGGFNEYGLAPVSYKGKWGLIDRRNQARIPLKYSGLELLDDRVVLGQKDTLTYKDIINQ